MSVPAAFDYHVASSVDEAIALMQQYGDDAKFLAGGHSLLPTMKLRLAQPGHLIDLGRIQGLSYVLEDDGAVAVGAMTTYVTLERSSAIQSNFALLPEGISQIGDQQVRNRGTIGGSVAHSDPAADTPGMVLALKADILAQGPNGVRTIKADDFFQDLFQTALGQDEVITEIRFAKPAARTGSANGRSYMDGAIYANAEFVQAFRGKYNTDPDQFAAQAYTGVLILVDAAKRAKLTYTDVAGDRHGECDVLIPVVVPHCLQHDLQRRDRHLSP